MSVHWSVHFNNYPVVIGQWYNALHVISRALYMPFSRKIVEDDTALLKFCHLYRLFDASICSKYFRLRHLQSPWPHCSPDFLHRDEGHSRWNKVIGVGLVMLRMLKPFVRFVNVVLLLASAKHGSSTVQRKGSFEMNCASTGGSSRGQLPKAFQVFSSVRSLLEFTETPTSCFIPVWLT